MAIKLKLTMRIYANGSSVVVSDNFVLSKINAEDVDDDFLNDLSYIVINSEYRDPKYFDLIPLEEIDTKRDELSSLGIHPDGTLYARNNISGTASLQNGGVEDWSVIKSQTKIRQL